MQVNRTKILAVVVASILAFSPVFALAQSTTDSSSNQESIGQYVFGTLISADEQMLTAIGSVVTRILGKTRILGGTSFGGKSTGSVSTPAPIITPSSSYTGLSGCGGTCLPSAVSTALQGSGFLESAIGNFDEPRDMWVESGCGGSCTGLNYTIGVIAVDGDRAQIDHVTFYLEGSTVTVTKPTKNTRTGSYSYVVNVQSGNCNGDVVLYADIYPTNGYVRRISLPLTVNTQTSSSVETVASCNVGSGSTQSGLIAHAIRYIAPGGSDSNNGTSPALAWASFNHAENVANGALCGMTVYVTSGTYPGPTYLEDNSNTGTNNYPPCRMIQFLPATPGQYYTISKTTRSSGGATYLGVFSAATLFDSAVFSMDKISEFRNAATGETIVLRNSVLNDPGGPTGKTFAQGLIGMSDGVLNNQPQLFNATEGRFNAIIDSPITSVTVQAAGVDFIRNWKVNLAADTISEFANAANQPLKTIINMVSNVVNLFWERFTNDAPQNVTVASLNYCTNSVYIPSSNITIPAGSTIITLNVPTAPEAFNGGMQGNGNNQYVVFGSGGSLFNGALMAFNGFGNNTGAEVDGGADPSCGGAVLIPSGTSTQVPFISVKGNYTTDAWARTSFPNDINPVPASGTATAYNAATTYTQFTVVSESGMDFVSMAAGNVGNDPVLDTGNYWKNVVAAPVATGQTVFMFIAFHDDLGQFTALNSTALNYSNIIFQGSYLRGVDVQPFLYQPGALTPVMTGSQSGTTFSTDPMSYSSGAFSSPNTTISWSGSPALTAYTPGYFGNQIAGSLTQNGTVSMAAGCSTTCTLVGGSGNYTTTSFTTRFTPDDRVSVTGEPGVWKVISITDDNHMTITSLSGSTSVSVSSVSFAKIGTAVHFTTGALAGQEFPIANTAQTTSSTIVIGSLTGAASGDTAYITQGLEPGDFIQWQNCVGNSANNKASGAVIARPTPYTATLDTSYTCGVGSTYTVAKSMVNMAYIGTILATNTSNQRTFYDLGQLTNGHKNIVFIGATIYGTYIDFRTTQAAYGYKDFGSFDSVWSTTGWVGGNALQADGTFPTQINFDTNSFFNATASGFTKGTNGIAKVWAAGTFDSGTTTANTYKPLDTTSTGLQQHQRGLVGNAYRANGCPIYPYSQDGRAIGCGTAIPNPYVGAQQP